VTVTGVGGDGGLSRNQNGCFPAWGGERGQEILSVKMKAATMGNTSTGNRRACRVQTWQGEYLKGNGGNDDRRGRTGPRENHLNFRLAYWSGHPHKENGIAVDSVKNEREDWRKTVG